MPRVDLNVYIVGQARDESESHVRTASTIYGAHGITFHVRHKDTIPDRKLVNPMNGKFYESSFELLEQTAAFTQETDCIDVYYMPEFSSGDVRGVTARPNGQPEGYRGRPPIRPIVVLNAVQADNATLAHELGHALLDDGKHEADAGNLMAAGAARTGTSLTPAQVQKIKQSRYVKP